MSVIRYAALAAAIVSSSAAAQQTTDCQRDQWGNTRCRTTGSPTSGGVDWGLGTSQTNPADSFQRGYEQGQAIRARREAMKREQAAHDARMAQWAQQGAEAERRQVLDKQAGQLVASGDCAGAEKLALDAGDFGLAKSIKDYCANR